MTKIKTNWTRATTNPNEAMIAFTACLASGKNAWIEVLKNGDQEFPIMKKNPALEDPFNWTMSYGEPRNEQQLKETSFFNETEKDLAYNWTSCYGTKEAVEEYQKNGRIMEGLILGGGTECPVKIEDANRYRKEITGDNYKYNYWVTKWKAKDGIPYWILDEDIGDVFTVCYKDEPANMKDALAKAARYLLAYEKTLEDENEASSS